MATKSQDDEVIVVGATPHPFRDAYHSILRMSWPGVLLGIAGSFLFMNMLFAFAYESVGGVVGVKHGSIRDAFFFSVQTMGTIGYGTMVPATATANVLVVLESVTSLIFTAVVTGLLF
ncbi:MAG: ion channel, partial [Polyangiaceae bacterium]